MHRSSRLFVALVWLALPPSALSIVDAKLAARRATLNSKLTTEGAQAAGTGAEARIGQTPTKVTNESFLDRLKDSMASFIVGLFLIIFSFPVMWFNESRSARMQSLIGWGESECRTVSGATADPKNRNCLVHLPGEQMRSAATVSDGQFNVALERDCVRLRRLVEVFQVIEHEKKEEKEKIGGGKETIHTYTYTTEWKSSWHDSSGYNDQRQQNSKPEGLELGARDFNCSRVEYGDAFLLTQELVNQCASFTSAASRLGDAVELRGGNCTFTKEGGDGFFYFRKNAGQTASSPRVGDARVKFEYVPDSPATVLALQVEHESGSRDSFLPYRLISRGCCGRNEDEEKLQLRRMAEKSREDLAKEAQCGTGCLWCVCCACNLVNMCCASLLTPEINDLFPGRLGSGECFKVIKTKSAVMVWILRLGGWLMLFIGLFSLFQPILTFIKVIPWLGPILSSVGGWAIWILCFILTLAVASVFICFAYLVFHPLAALLYSLVAAAIIVVPIVIIKAASS